MTLRDAIKLLEDMLRKRGDIDLYFDCPQCGQSFSPNTLKALAAHLSHNQNAEAERAP